MATGPVAGQAAPGRDGALVRAFPALAVGPYRLLLSGNLCAMLAYQASVVATGYAAFQMTGEVEGQVAYVRSACGAGETLIEPPTAAGAIPVQTAVDLGSEGHGTRRRPLRSVAPAQQLGDGLR